MSDHSSHSHSKDDHAHSPAELQHHIALNTKIFAFLLGLTGITIAFCFINLGKANALVQVLLLLAKCGFVAGFVTFLLHRSKMLTNLLIFTGIFLVALIALTVWGSLWGSPIPGTVPVK